MRKKKQTSRRRSALRWLIILVLLAAVLAFPGRYHFLPSQAIREAERLEGIGPTELIWEMEDPVCETPFPITVRGNRRGMMCVSLYHWAREGWGARTDGYVDCSVPRPFYVGYDEQNVILETEDGTREDDEIRIDTVMVWYGRVDDPTAETVRLEWRKRGELQKMFLFPREEWIRQDGLYYFAVAFESGQFFGGAADNSLHSYLLDGEGNQLSSWEMNGDMWENWHFEGTYQ